MTGPEATTASLPSLPRFLRVGRFSVSSFQILCCIGICTGSFLNAAVAEHAGVSPLRMGFGSVSCGFAGLLGARLWHLVLAGRNGEILPRWPEILDGRSGGGRLFGAFGAVALWSCLLAPWLRLPLGQFWDLFICGVVNCAFWMRLGCVCNGCCGGRATTGWYGLPMHDVHGRIERRIPVPWLEIGWWALAAVGLAWWWPAALPSGTYGLGVLAWYGVGRFLLEPLRQRSDRIAGGVRVHQLMAGVLALLCGGGLLVLQAPTFLSLP